MKRKGLAWILAVCLTVGVLPVWAQPEIVEEAGALIEEATGEETEEGGEPVVQEAEPSTSADPREVKDEGEEEPYTMKGLKKGINYIKVRSYVKDANKKTVYGPWSKTWKVKIQ